MSKAHDDPSNAKEPTRGVKAADGKKVVAEGATPRRVRSAGPRERSGPIGISSGDFATPLVRKRTTTQPRGVPVVGGKPPAPSLDEPVTAGPEELPDEIDDDGQLTPAPQQPADTTDVGAVPGPMNALDAIPVAMPIRPPPPPVAGEESPFGGGGSGARVDIDAEAAALAAEAAAVRALDSGPLTPPPEVLAAAPEKVEPADDGGLDAPTPPPEIAAAPSTEPAETAPEPTPPPQVSEGPRTPPPELNVTRTPPPEVKAASEITVIRTPPPELVEATRTPPPDVSMVSPYPPRGSAEATPADDTADQVTPPPELKPPVDVIAPPGMDGDNGALPAAMNADAGLAALPAAALVDSGGSDPAFDGEVDGDDHVEMMEGADDGVVASPAAQAKSLRNAAPPPIPGSHLRTPGPELVARVVPTAPVDEGAPVTGLPILPEAITQRPRRPKRSKPWFEEVFDEDYLRTLPFMRADQTLREVEFISDALRVGPGAEILDIACGYGRHAIELVQRGYNVTGLDLSLPLLLRAADESKRRALSVNFVHADMREMAFEKQFDGAYSMLTSFGYFDEDTNLRVAERIGRALKPGARFLLDVVNRDYVVSDLPMRVWWEGTGCVVLEEVDFNFHTSRIVTHRSIVFEDGRQLEQEISVRAYSLHEIGRLLRQAGFRVMDVSGGLNTRGQFFGNVSRSLLIVAEKRESDTVQPL